MFYDIWWYFLLSKSFRRRQLAYIYIYVQPFFSFWLLPEEKYKQKSNSMKT